MRITKYPRGLPVAVMFKFSIDRGGTFTDVYAECPSGKVRALKLLSDDPRNYKDAPTEAIRRILEEVTIYFSLFFVRCVLIRWSIVVGLC